MRIGYHNNLYCSYIIRKANDILDWVILPSSLSMLHRRSALEKVCLSLHCPTGHLSSLKYKRKLCFLNLSTINLKANLNNLIYDVEVDTNQLRWSTKPFKFLSECLYINGGLTTLIPFVDFKLSKSPSLHQLLVTFSSPLDLSCFTNDKSCKIRLFLGLTISQDTIPQGKLNSGMASSEFWPRISVL